MLNFTDILGAISIDGPSVVSAHVLENSDIGTL